MNGIISTNYPTGLIYLLPYTILSNRCMYGKYRKTIQRINEAM